jgi:hypothetical protein
MIPSLQNQVETSPRFRQEERWIQNQDYTHVTFADESNWNEGRFRSISLVTTTVENARIFHGELDALRQSQNKKEFKWHKVVERHGIVLTYFFSQRSNQMRVDILVLDTRLARQPAG